MTIDPSRVQKRPAAQADLDFVLRVSEICMRDYVEQIWGSWDIEIPRTRFVPGRYMVVTLDKEDVGCLDVWDEEDHIQLNIIYLLPKAQRQGLGTFLMRELLENADAAGKPVRLKVLRPNPVCRFYERFGFAVTETAPERFFMERPTGSAA